MTNKNINEALATNDGIKEEDEAWEALQFQWETDPQFQMRGYMMIAKNAGVFNCSKDKKTNEDEAFEAFRQLIKFAVDLGSGREAIEQIGKVIMEAMVDRKAGEFYIAEASKIILEAGQTIDAKEKEEAKEVAERIEANRRKKIEQDVVTIVLFAIIIFALFVAGFWWQ